MTTDELLILRFVLKPVFNNLDKFVKIDRRAPPHTALPDHQGFPTLALPL